MNGESPVTSRAERQHPRPPAPRRDGLGPAPFGHRRPLGLAFLSLVVVVLACSPEEPRTQTTLDRDTFIATWIDLRQAALQSPDGDVPPGERERIFAEHGASAESMEQFVEVRGTDADYMRTLWEEVERRMRIEAGEIPADSAEGGGGDASA